MSHQNLNHSSKILVHPCCNESWSKGQYQHLNIYRVLLVLKVPLARLEKKERGVQEENLEVQDHSDLLERE